MRLVEGSYTNLKVTTPEDMVVAGALLERDVTKMPEISGRF